MSAATTTKPYRTHCSACGKRLESKPTCGPQHEREYDEAIRIAAKLREVPS